MSGMSVFRDIEGQECCHDIDLPALGNAEQAVQVAPVGSCCPGDKAVGIDINPDLTIADHPNARRVHAVIVQLLEVTVPPAGVIVAAKDIPVIPGSICPVHPDALTAGHKLAAAD